MRHNRPMQNQDRSHDRRSCTARLERRPHPSAHGACDPGPASVRSTRQTRDATTSGRCRRGARGELPRGRGHASRAFLADQDSPIRDGQGPPAPYDPAADLAQSMAGSLEHLGTDHVDCFVLHGPASGRGWTGADTESWNAMRRERDAKNEHERSA